MTTSNSTDNRSIPANADFDALASARRTLQIEQEAVAAVASQLDAQFVAAVNLVLQSTGRVVVTGVGKTGHIGRKLAATFASTGTPAFFMHAAEASHGDLGMITAQDVVLALSNSGSSQELLSIVPQAQRFGAKLIAITGSTQSPLAQMADIHLLAQAPREACPLNLAPTASTTAALALGDALAVACLEARGFNEEDFARSHPGGALGRRLLTRVQDVMRTGSHIPTVPLTATISQALAEISAKRMGMTVVMNDGRIAGIFTDGDVRRLIEKVGDIRTCVLADVMTKTPLSITPHAMAVQAAELMDTHRKNVLLVLEGAQLVGALHLHDLMAAKVI